MASDDFRFDQRAERRRHDWAGAEPTRERGRGLVEQHAQSLCNAQSARSRRFDKWGAQGNIDSVCDHGSPWQSADIHLECRLSGHPKRAGVHEQVCLRQFCRQIAPGHRDCRTAEMLGQRFGSGLRSVEDCNAFKAA